MRPEGPTMRLARWLLLPLFAAAATAGAAEGSVQALRHFTLLQAAQVRYAALAADPALTALPALPSRSISIGDHYAGTQALHRLLTALGDVPDSGSTSGSVLDAGLVEGIRRFQERHGLDADGILGPATWRALTTPLSQRARQIERTLERWRQLPPNPGQRAIFINIPQFRLFGLHAMDESEAQMLRMNVVVGRDTRSLRTPTFVADMTHLVFRPYWEVPNSIAVRELLPAIHADSGYLARHHLEVVTPAGAVMEPSVENLAAVAEGKLRLRQRPGPDNALGTVKFVLPNPHTVYLHDTPDHSLFSRERRAFSHGCVRVSDARALAGFVLQDDPEWTPARIQEAMSGASPLRVDLKQPIRVYVVYGTAIATESGKVLFFDDLYGLDED